MINVIKYYYNMKNISIHKVGKKVFVKHRNDIYFLQEIDNQEKVLEIYNLLKWNNNFYSFVINKDQSIFTPYNGKVFVLLRKYILNSVNMIRNVVIEKNIVDKLQLNRKNWQNLWERKIDYYEYQMNHIYGKFPIIDESIDYYIGMTETAISFFYYNHLEGDDGQLVACHHRVIDDEFEIHNPLNVVVDYRERELGEYLKTIFWSNNYKNKDLYKLLKNFNCSKLGYYRLYARMLYPSYYFDLYDKIVNENEKQGEISKILVRVEEYEHYLQRIHEIINSFFEFQNIDWIKKT